MPEVIKAPSQATESDRFPRKRRTKTGVNDKKIADDEFMAAAIGDVEWLRQSLREARGAINYDKNGLTSLHLASIHGRIECLKLLIEKYKFDINLPSTTGWRACHLCISNQTGKRALQCLTYLLEKKADPSLSNNDGVTPVHQAASEGHVQCLKLLIDVGAPINVKDCRGHTPLDLAKLWGHKKCARILAAEGWHQGKDQVAKEMEYLKKLKLQNMLKELEEAEEHKAAQEFYGEKAFQDWLKKQNLSPQPTGPTEKGSKGGLTKTNSKTKPPGKGQAKKDDKEKKNPSSLSDGSIPMERKTNIPVQEPEQVQGKYGDDKSENETKKPKVKTETYVNPDDWKLALHLPKKEYIPNLKDDYPRDQYTRMPKIKSAPMYYDGKFGSKVYASDANSKVKRVKLKERNVELSKEVVEKIMSKDPSLSERPMIFKPFHMDDVEKKKKYDAEIKGRSEVGLHMCDDMKSFLFQNALKRANTYHEVVSESDSSSKTPSSKDWTSDKYPKSKVLNTLKSMSKPDRYPNIKGEEYLFHTGSL